MPFLSFNTQPSNSIISARNGLTKVGSFVELGGTLIHDTTVTQAGFNLEFTDATTGLSIINGQITRPIAGVITGSGVQYNDGTDYFLTFVNDSVASLAWEDAAGGVRNAYIEVGKNNIDISRFPNATDRNNINISDTLVGMDMNVGGTIVSSVVVDVTGVSMAAYPNTRDDTGTLTPANFLYTGAAGEVYSAPISALGAGWALTGNAGLTDGVDNFLGTTDGQVPIRFLVDNTNAGQISSPTTLNTFFGLYAGDEFSVGSFTTGIQNTGIGDQSLILLFSGSNNTCVGHNSGATIISGQDNVFVGSGADSPTNTITNSIGLAANASVLANNEFAIGTQDHLNFELNGATVGYVLTCDAANSQIWKLPSATSNTDTPTLSNTVNITASAVNVDTSFIQVVDAVTGETIVTAQYSLLIQPTTTLTLTTIDVTLPVTANPSADLAGQGAYNNNNAPVAALVTPVDSTHARVTFVPVATGSNYILSFSISYRAN